MKTIESIAEEFYSYIKSISNPDDIDVLEHDNYKSFYGFYGKESYYFDTYFTKEGSVSTIRVSFTTDKEVMSKVLNSLIKIEPKLVFELIEGEYDYVAEF